MKDSDEMMNSLLERRERYYRERKEKQKKALRITVPALSLALVLASAFILWRSGMFRPAAGPVTGLSSGEGPGDTGHMPGEADGYDPGPSETRLKLLGDVSYEGEVITEEEASAYFTREYRSIKSALEASGVPAENMVISGRGYCHVKWNGGYPVVRQDFRDYPVYSGGRLISIITITKENGRIGNSIAFGGDWSAYLEFLKEHAGEELIYIYTDLEIVIAPGGECVTPSGLTVDYENAKEIYDHIIDERIAYVPSVPEDR